MDFDPAAYGGPQLLPTVFCNPAVGGGRERTLLAVATPPSLECWHRVLSASSCLCRLSPDRTCEVRNTVIQAHSPVADRKGECREGKNPEGRDQVPPLLISLQVLPTHRGGGSLPTALPCFQIHAGSSHTRRIVFPLTFLLTISRNQNKYHLITWAQIPGKASKPP